MFYQLKSIGQTSTAYFFLASTEALALKITMGINQKVFHDSIKNQFYVITRLTTPLPCAWGYFFHGHGGATCHPWPNNKETGF